MDNNHTLLRPIKCGRIKEERVKAEYPSQDYRRAQVTELNRKVVTKMSLEFAQRF